MILYIAQKNILVPSRPESEIISEVRERRWPNATTMEERIDDDRVAGCGGNRELFLYKSATIIKLVEKLIVMLLVEAI